MGTPAALSRSRLEQLCATLLRKVPQLQFTDIVDDTAIAISMTTARLANGFELQLGNDLDEPQFFEVLRVRGGDVDMQLPFEGWEDEEPRSLRLNSEQVVDLVGQYARQPLDAEGAAPARQRADAFM